MEQTKEEEEDGKSTSYKICKITYLKYILLPNRKVKNFPVIYIISNFFGKKGQKGK